MEVVLRQSNEEAPVATEILNKIMNNIKIDGSFLYLMTLGDVVQKLRNCVKDNLSTDSATVFNPLSSKVFSKQLKTLQESFINLQ